MPKDFSIQNLFQDLEYTIFGTEAHARLHELFPPHEGAMVLEPGCGCGKLGLSYAMGGCEAILLDVDPEVAAYARRLRGALNSLIGHPLPVQIRIGNILRMHFKDESFDLVFNEGVPQHWSDGQRQESINQMVRVAKGMIIIIGNNGANPHEAEEDGTRRFTYMGMPPVRKCFTPDELESSLKRAGLKGIQVGPVTPGRIEDSILLIGWGRK